MYQIFFADSFVKKLRGLSRNDKSIKKRIDKQLGKLIDNPQHSSLRLHKLSGTDNWSISVNKSIRIIFSIRENIILCTDIGTHDEVY